jgi:hypothetical protein
MAPTHQDATPLDEDEAMALVEVPLTSCTAPWFTEMALPTARLKARTLMGTELEVEEVVVAHAVHIIVLQVLMGTRGSSLRRNRDMAMFHHQPALTHLEAGAVDVDVVEEGEAGPAADEATEELLLMEPKARCLAVLIHTCTGDDGWIVHDAVSYNMMLKCLDCLQHSQRWDKSCGYENV